MKRTKRMGVIELVSETDNPSNDGATGVHVSNAYDEERVISFSKDNEQSSTFTCLFG